MKTLKDFWDKRTTWAEEDSIPEYNRRLLTNLKAEAIKCIKAGNNRLDEFCNLTEKDLK